MSDKPSKNFQQPSSFVQRAAAERTEAAARQLRSVQAQIDAIERGDFESLLRDAHDDVTLEIFAPPQFPFIAAAHGRSELLAAVTHNFATVDEQTPHIRDIFTEGDTVILFGRERGKVRLTGAPYDVEFVQRLTFRDSRLASIRIVVADAGRPA